MISHYLNFLKDLSTLISYISLDMCVHADVVIYNICTHIRKMQISLLDRAGKTGHPTRPVKTRDPFSLDPDTNRLC
jgi:hypothetical protein